MARNGTLALAATALGLLLAAPAHAKLFTVTTDADGAAAGATNDGVCATATAGACTLRAAVEEANGTSGSDEIALPARNYVLTGSTELTLTSNVTITGEGARTTIVDAGGDSRVFKVTGGSVVLNGIAITGGVASQAGGIDVEGTSTELILDRVDVHGNTAVGAVDQYGGGIELFQGGLIVRRSAIRDNTASATGSGHDAHGGGVLLNGLALSAAFENTTIAGNKSIRESGSSAGGGVESIDVPVTLRHVTLTGNAAGIGGNIFANHLDDVALENTIVANGVAGSGRNCSGGVGTPTSTGVNLASDTSCSLPAGNPIADPLLDPLGDHGGPTATAPPRLGSPALDKASACYGSPTTADQRGQATPLGPACDLGAAELGADLSATLTPSASSVNAGESLTYVETLRNNGFDAAPGTLTFTPPAGTSAAFVSSLAGSCTGTAPVVCSYNTLAPGASVDASIVVKAPASGPISATTTASGPVPEVDASNNTATATTDVVPAVVPPGEKDVTPPILGGLRLVGKLSRKKGGKLRYTLSEDATLAIRLDRIVKKKGKRARFVKVGTKKLAGQAGEHTLKLGAHWSGKRPKRGRYRLKLVATDAAGNSAKAKTLAVRVRR